MIPIKVRSMDKVILYAKERCPPCKMIKQFIEEKKMGGDIEVRDLSVFREEFDEAGFTIVPTIVHEGAAQGVYQGWDECADFIERFERVD